MALIICSSSLISNLATAPSVFGYPVDSSGSWNPHVACASPAIVKISDITDNMTGSNSYNNSPFSPGITENPFATGSDGAKRWLTPGDTPPGWQNPGPDCTITNSKGQTIASFVEIDGVGRGAWSYDDCRGWYDAVNGRAQLPPGHWCDTSVNLFDPSIVPNESNSCTSANDPTCWGKIHVEFDGDWLARGYCGTGTVCDNNTLIQQTVSGSAQTLIDVQGFVYWDTVHVNEQWHSFSGWELHPLSAWRLHKSTTPLSASFSYSPSSPQTGQPVTFTATANGGVSPYSYNWSFGDGSTGSGSSTSHTYASAGSYNVVLTVRDSGSPPQTANSQKTITVTAPTQVPLTTSFSYTPSSPGVNEPIIFSATANGGTSPYTFSWQFGDGATTGGSTVTHSYSSPGSYIVTLTTKDSSTPPQSASFQKSITVTSATSSLTSSFTYSPSSPTAGQQVTFSASASGGTAPYTFAWTLGDGSTGTGATVTHAYSTAGSFIVTLMTKDSSSPQQTSTSQQTITVASSPTLIASITFTPSSSDAGQSVAFTGSASGGVSPYSYSWTFGDGTTGTGPSTTHAYASAGTYTVALTVADSAGHKASSSQSVTVAAKLSGSFSMSPSSPTVLQTVTFSATATGGSSPYSYSWDFGDSSTATGQTASHSYLLPGTYTVTLTITDANGQTFTESQTVTVSAGIP